MQPKIDNLKEFIFLLNKHLFGNEQFEKHSIKLQHVGVLWIIIGEEQKGDVTINDLIHLTGAAKNTLLGIVNQLIAVNLLVKKQVLAPHGKGRKYVFFSNLPDTFKKNLNSPLTSASEEREEVKIDPIYCSEDDVLELQRMLGELMFENSKLKKIIKSLEDAIK